jgi:hypothetical protein
VVDTVVVEEKIRSTLEQSECERRTSFYVDGTRHVIVHPLKYGGSRIRLAAEVKDSYYAVGIWTKVLPRADICFNEMHAERVGSGHHSAHRRLKQRWIDVSKDFQILAQIECGAFGIQYLSKPDRRLCDRERP